MRPLILSALAAPFVAGCLSTGGGGQALKVIQDPTPLAKCQIGKNHASPLVTEWPASEKAHLESMLSEQAVVVSYSGCEMRILDACKPKGNYKFKRTTLARDTIEINDADDLYAKIPLGAVNLEGELQRSGRLAVKTSVAGQMRLDGGIDELPDGRGCKDATHVIDALSVGAFTLMSGGAVSGRGGVGVGSAGAGFKHSKEEKAVKSAGDAEACRKTSHKPNPDCNSPIQVFLVPLDQAVAEGAPEPVVEPSPEPKPKHGRKPKPDTKADDARRRASEAKQRRLLEKKRREEERLAKRRKRPDLNPDESTALEVHFEAPDDGSWMLLSGKGEKLCKLPCMRMVGKRSGFQVQLDADKAEDIEVVKVPADLGYSPGRKVKAVPLSARNTTAGALLFYGGILAGLGFAGLAAAQCPSDVAGEPKDDALCGLGIGGSVVGIGAAIGGGIWWYGFSREASLEVTLIDGDSAATDVKLQYGPTGVSGSF